MIVYHLRDGLLFRASKRGTKIVTAPYVTYLGRTVKRLDLVWFLAFGHWPEGYVYSVDETSHPTSLRVRPAKDIGVFKPGLKESQR